MKYEFRGKRRTNCSDNGTWIYGYLQDRNLIRAVINVRTSEICEVYPETIGLFTGIVDKNSRKIFEGDIIEVTDISTGQTVYYGKGAVVLEDGNFGIHFYEKDKYGDGINLLSGLTYKPYGSQVEVIGNIHDNPELLEER